jgi:hypothetical protein
MPMHHHRPSTSRRTRIIASSVVLAGSLLVALGLVAGIGLAGTSPGAAQYQYGKRVTICHQTHSKKHPNVTITVSKSALRAHLRHGDTIGPCAAPTSSAKHGEAGKHHSSSTSTTTSDDKTKKGAGHSKGSNTTTTTTTTATTATTSSDKGQGNGHGNGHH